MGSLHHTMHLCLLRSWGHRVWRMADGDWMHISSLDTIMLQVVHEPVTRMRCMYHYQEDVLTIGELFRVGFYSCRFRDQVSGVRKV